jgi:hypothetical protein
MNNRLLTKGKLKARTEGRTSTTGSATPPPKVSPTTPITVFQRSIERAENLLAIHKIAHDGTSALNIWLADVYRASIVLAVSALDAYIRTLVVNKVLTILRDVNKTVPLKLREQLKQLISQDDFLDAARVGDISTRVEKALKDKFEDSSFQGVNKITEAMKLVGREDIFKEVARSASMNEQELKENLGRYTKRRHIIAHCGDYDMTQSPPNENIIKKKDAADCIKLMRQVAHQIDKLLKL